MKNLLTFILILTVCSTTFSQNYPQALIDSFCNSTIEYYYVDDTKFAKAIDLAHFKPKNQFMLKKDITKNLRANYKYFNVSFLTREEAIEKICFTKGKKGSLDAITVTQLKDTINIDISGWEITIEKVKFVKRRPTNIHSSFGARCGGTLGYIPTCRFVYDSVNNKWSRYTRAEIVAAIINK